MRSLPGMIVSFVSYASELFVFLAISSLIVCFRNPLGTSGSTALNAQASSKRVKDAVNQEPASGFGVSETAPAQPSLLEELCRHACGQDD